MKRVTYTIPIVILIIIIFIVGCGSTDTDADVDINLPGLDSTPDEMEDSSPDLDSTPDETEDPLPDLDSTSDETEDSSPDLDSTSDETEDSLPDLDSTSDETEDPLPTVEIGDPLYSEQWHLKNTGQRAYADNSGTAGVDLNLAGVTQTGSGVVVNVVDSGMEILHEDLKSNVIAGSFNFVNNSNDPTLTESSGDHGTSVAGIIAATANNGLGGRGVANKASLIAHNYIQSQNNFSIVTSVLAPADINNHSFGIDNTFVDIRISSTEETAYLEGVTSGRSNKGKIYVKAAGNGFEDFIRVGDSFQYSCLLGIDRIGDYFNLRFISTAFTTSALSCENVNLDPDNTLPYIIVVAAMNANGIKSSYSTTGSAILVSGFGGEEGTVDPAIITTDQSGCNKGYSSVGGTIFNRGEIPEINSNCNYINTFNGTSSATPTVSGVVALMLEANPNLSWRDVRHILVNTAKKVDSTRNAIKTIDSKPSSIIADATAELGWVTNKAGYEFHNWYGFGLVDAAAAVTMADGYSSTLGDFKTVSSENDTAVTIPDKNFDGAESTINITQNLTIESIQIDIQVTHPFTADLGIWLTSPNKTTSILLTPFNNFALLDTSNVTVTSDKDLNIVLASQAFYGETAQGNWSVKVIDYWAGSSGTLDSWKLIIYGY